MRRCQAEWAAPCDTVHAVLYQILDNMGNKPVLQQPADSCIRDNAGADFELRLIPPFAPTPAGRTNALWSRKYPLLVRPCHAFALRCKNQINRWPSRWSVAARKLPRRHPERGHAAVRLAPILFT